MRSEVGLKHVVALLNITDWSGGRSGRFGASKSAYDESHRMFAQVIHREAGLLLKDPGLSEK